MFRIDKISILTCRHPGTNIGWEKSNHILAVLSYPGNYYIFYFTIFCQVNHSRHTYSGPDLVIDSAYCPNKHSLILNPINCPFTRSKAFANGGM